MTRALEALLFPHARAAGRPATPRPTSRHLHQELKRKGVTLQLLWEEYAAAHPEAAYRYSQFCWHYGRFREQPEALHAPGAPRRRQAVHRLQRRHVPIIDAATGEIRSAEMFVAVLGASNYTYAEATWTQQLPDWIGSHVRCLRVHGRRFRRCWSRTTSRARSSRPVATSPRRPRPTPIWRATTRRRSFQHARFIPATKPPWRRACSWSSGGFWRGFATASSSRSPSSTRRSGTLLVDLNSAPFKKLEGCRASAFAPIDRPAMMPLPPQRYEFAEWKTAIVNIDYHVEVDGHYYSVPHRLVRQKVEVRFTATTVECFFKGKRVAAHAALHACAGATPPAPSTCPSRTASTCSGRRGACSTGRCASARPPATWCAGSWRTARIPSRATAPAWGCSTSPATTARPAPGSRLPAGAGDRLAHPQAHQVDPRGQARSTPGVVPGRGPMPPQRAQAAPHANVRGPEYFRSTTTDRRSSNHAHPTHPRYTEPA